MSPTEKERLAKVLALTTSNIDGEALAAVRKANQLLAKDGVTWEQLLTATGSNFGAFAAAFAKANVVYKERPPPASELENLRSMISMLLTKIREDRSTRLWLNQLLNTVVNGEAIADRQREALIDLFIRYDCDLAPHERGYQKRYTNNF